MTDSWISQPNLPSDIQPDQSTVLTWRNTALALFIGEDKIYQFQEDGSWSALEGVLLPLPYFGFTNGRAMIVPDDFAGGCM